MWIRLTRSHFLAAAFFIAFFCNRGFRLRSFFCNLPGFAFRVSGEAMPAFAASLPTVLPMAFAASTNIPSFWSNFFFTGIEPPPKY